MSWACQDQVHSLDATDMAPQTVCLPPRRQFANLCACSQKHSLQVTYLSPLRCVVPAPTPVLLHTPCCQPGVCRVPTTPACQGQHGLAARETRVSPPPPAPSPGPPGSSKRMGSEGIPAPLREETAHTGFPSPHVWQLVLRINAIYEARRGKKRVKRLSQSTESNSGKGRGPATVPPPPRI